MQLRMIVGISAVAALVLVGGCRRSSGPDQDGKVMRMPISSAGPDTMDPADGSTLYENQCISQVYEPLLQYKYLSRPLELEPLLLAEMPEVSADGLTYRFTLKPGVRFHDDPCFPGGKGRELVAADVIYSWKRLADDDVSLKNWWLIKGTIQGMDPYRDAQNAAETFDYDAPVEGLEIIDDQTFKVVLQQRVTRFPWTLAMFQMSIVPREAVEKYGTKFARHPVGTGPYTMAQSDWIPNQSMVLKKNPNYHPCFYPDEHLPEDEALGLHADAGKRLPFLDRIELRFFVEEQPMWLEFDSGKLDCTRVPRDNLEEAFNLRKQQLRPEFAKKGIVGHPVPLLDFIFYGFNMEDELLGGYTEEKRALRQALALAIDWEERNEVIYRNVCRIYDGMIPPGLDGHPQDGDGPVSFRGPDLERAKELLAKAGYPDAKGLPTIDFYSSLEGPGKESAELTARHLKQLGVEINPRLDVFPAFMETVNSKKAPFFSFAWGSDYPDAENNLALFYGPNESPGSNHFNYKNAEYDRLYEKILTMPPSPERTAVYEQMRDIVLRDTPFLGSLARTRFYLAQPWLKNYKPTEDFANWLKYLDLDESQRP